MLQIAVVQLKVLRGELLRNNLKEWEANKVWSILRFEK